MKSPPVLGTEGLEVAVTVYHHGPKLKAAGLEKTETVCVTDVVVCEVLVRGFGVLKAGEVGVLDEGYHAGGKISTEVLDIGTRVLEVLDVEVVKAGYDGVPQTVAKVLDVNSRLPKSLKLIVASWILCF